MLKTDGAIIVNRITGKFIKGRFFSDHLSDLVQLRNHSEAKLIKY